MLSKKGPVRNVNTNANLAQRLLRILVLLHHTFLADRSE